MNGFKVFCIVMIVLGVGIFGFGFFRYQQEIGAIQTPTLADPTVFDIADMTTAKEEVVVANADEVPDGEITSTNGDVVDDTGDASTETSEGASDGASDNASVETQSSETNDSGNADESTEVSENE